MTAAEPAEEDLVAGLLRGEAAAFDRAYARYRGRLYGFLRRLAGRRDLADDLFQETWIQLARHATRLAPDTELGAWLFTVARNRYRSHRRFRLVDRGRVEGAMVLAAAEPPARTPEGEAERAEEQARIERALGALGDGDREVLLLVGVEGLPQEQVATILGIRHDALRQRLARARGRLRELLAREP
jgi:RNA polymerase sigma-70 factor (ECF subfamily)